LSQLALQEPEAEITGDLPPTAPGSVEITYVTNKAVKRSEFTPIQNALHTLPYIGVHVGALLVFFVGFSWIALATCLLLYWVRMFGITGGYHRYFSHRSFKTTRTFQFILAVLGNASAQMGPLWWAAHHRHHHRHSDTEDDTHSPHIHGFLWSHTGWFLSPRHAETNGKEIRDLVKYPELIWLNENHSVVPILLASSLFGLGLALAAWAPWLGTNGLQMLIWGFFLSTVILYHGTFTINSLAHIFGYRTFETRDSSRNNWLLAILTMGEGWHNNHHRYPSSERQGFYWWEFDLTHLVLRGLEKVGIVWDLREPPREILESGRSTG
jgi:stearoyl-CoA desaturase (delta-9 desaturase)